MKMNIHKNKMLWYNTRYCIRASYERSQSMEYCCSAKEWRIGEPKSKSGYRTIPSTEEAVTILKKEKNKKISEISTGWEGFVFLCLKGTPVKNSTYDITLFKICGKAKLQDFRCISRDILLLPDVLKQE